MDAFYANTLSPRVARRGTNYGYCLAQLLLIMAISCVAAQEFLNSKGSRTVSQNLPSNEISESTNSGTRFPRRYENRRVSFTTKENCKNSVDCDSEAARPTVTYQDAYRFRAQQCTEFDKKSYNGKKINWRPYLRDHLDECKLYCMAAGHKFYARLKNSVNDGTPCGKDYSNVCIKAKCQKRPRGCQSLDGPCVLEARKKVLGVFNSTSLNLGYNLVATIPAGATNITVEELSRSRSYLAIKDHNSGTYHLNGHWMISLSKTFQMGTSHVTYIRNGNTPRGGEMIKIDGPLDKSLDIMVIYQRDPSIVMYSYFVTEDEYKRLEQQSKGKGQHLYFPKGRESSQPTERTQNDRDSTQTTSGKEDSMTFLPGQKRGAYPSTGGQGFSYPHLSTGQGKSYADGQNQGGKQGSWHGSSWVQFGGDESGSKQTAESGTQFARKPFLNQQVFKPNQFGNSRLPQYQGGPRQGTRFGDSRNTGYQRSQWGTKVENRFSGSVVPENKDRSWQNPNAKKQFYTSNTQQNDRSQEYIWKVVGYTTCSSTCAGGVQSGIVKCVRRTTRVNVADSKCSLLRRQETRRVCNLQPCPASWVPQEWQACSKTCGEGSQIRDLMCKQVIERDGEKVTVMLPVNKCPVQSRPEVIRKCSVKECPKLAKPKWVVESWGKCSVECGHGVQKRKIVCKNYKNETVDNFECPLRKKPAVLKACYLGLCKADWYVRSGWSQCSRTCGSGYRGRPVVCARIEGSKVEEEHCKDKTKPADEQTCNTQNCKGIWVTSEWSKCSTDCGKGLQQRVVICMKSVNGYYVETFDNDCSLDDKPAVRKDCSGNCPPSWFATPWTQCSVTCDHGVESRHVSCLNGEGKRVGGCKAWERPQLRRACYPKACPGSQPAKKTNANTCKDNPPRNRKGYCHIIKRINYCRIPSYKRRCCQTCSPKTDPILGHI